MSEDITCVIPVRMGSQRCIRKNLRFLNTKGDTLLGRKCHQLKDIADCVDSIVVSSSDEEVWNYVSNFDWITIHKRDPWFSQNDTTGSELYDCLTSFVETPLFLYTTAMCPFVTSDLYHKVLYSKQLLYENTYDSIVTGCSVKQFLYNSKNQPLNFCATQVPRSQDVELVRHPTFGANLLQTRDIQFRKSLIGKNPLWIDVTQQESIDIDTEYDFSCAQWLITKNN